MDYQHLQPFDYTTLKHKYTLNQSICVPSLVQSYSICIEFMKQWFYSKFKVDPKTIFKSEYIEGKYIWDDLRKLSKLDLLKRQKPSLTITPIIDYSFDNDKIDLYPYGLSMCTINGFFDAAFFKDYKRNVFISMAMKTILMNFNFTIRVETKAQQLDIYEFMKLAHRSGFSDTPEVDLDFHVPYPIMSQLARDLGFNVTCVGDGYDQIENIPKFLKYINMHSDVPFLYKHRTINGKHEFFIRLQRVRVNIRPSIKDPDDGEREGHLTNNYSIELECEVRFPAPRMYAYLSSNEHHLQKVYSTWDQQNGSPITTYTFKAIPIPEENSHGWPLYMNTQYEQSIIEKGQPLNIDWRELIEGEIGQVIRDCLDQGLSPSIFLDFYVVNGGEVIRGYMDWEALVFRSYEPVRSMSSFIGIYVDMNYVNTMITNKQEFMNNRITKSKHVNAEEAVLKRGEEVK